MAQEEKEKDTKKNTSIVEDFYNKKGEETAENISKGGKEKTISLTDKINVEFIKDFGFFKKGHVQEVSAVAFEIYNDKKVVKKL